MLTEEQKEWLRYYVVTEYTENRDGSVDIPDNISIDCQYLTTIPVKFRHVHGYFDCSNNQLTTLENAPDRIGGAIYCYGNPLIPTKELFAYLARFNGIIENKTVFKRMRERLHTYYGLNDDNPILPELWEELMRAYTDVSGPLHGGFPVF